ncbi:hypothetical protein CPB84DRAFT_1242206 [Gymnopilus junonius]|uniref:Uncharacterized protein n=1 Tax=Gymnopilus junonius TaxID=109634 RepID=A0A9P5NKJ2_GYMJU|nr:hypothetical protein CPB84DRAFT_1242206 [Gymnopilus junonius]
MKQVSNQISNSRTMRRSYFAFILSLLVSLLEIHAAPTKPYLFGREIKPALMKSKNYREIAMINWRMAHPKDKNRKKFKGYEAGWTHTILTSMYSRSITLSTLDTCNGIQAVGKSLCQVSIIMKISRCFVPMSIMLR